MSESPTLVGKSFPINFCHFFFRPIYCKENHQPTEKEDCKMNDCISLFCLPAGKSGRVVSVDLPEDMRRRVLSLGLSAGTQVSCYAYAPCGNPGAYRIRGTTVALRKADAEKILIRPL